MMKKILLTSIVCAIMLCFVGCETWPVAAARTAKKRTTQTGPLVGELEQATGVDDPLGRDQVDVDEKTDQMSDKADKLGSRMEDVAGDL